MTIVDVCWHTSISLSLSLCSTCFHYNKYWLYLKIDRVRRNNHHTFLHIIHTKLFRTTNSVSVSVIDLKKNSLYMYTWCNHCLHRSHAIAVYKILENLWVIWVLVSFLFKNKWYLSHLNYECERTNNDCIVETH
jgi:hypothetical protein